MTFNEFKPRVYGEYRKIFNRCPCNVELIEEAQEKYMRIVCHIAEEADRINVDGLNLVFRVDLPEDYAGGELPEKVKMIACRKSYATKDGEKALPMRQTSGSPKKVLRMLYRNFEILRDALKADLHAGKLSPAWAQVVSERI